PLLRQHTLCRHARDRPQEQRVLVLGSSGPLGFPLPASEAAPAELDRLLVAHGLPARAFNLGFLNTYHLPPPPLPPPPPPHPLPPPLPGRPALRPRGDRLAPAHRRVHPRPPSGVRPRHRILHRHRRRPRGARERPAAGARRADRALQPLALRNPPDLARHRAPA